MQTTTFRSLALAAALTFSLIRPSLADTKSDALLAEVELRAKRTTTYSADITVTENGSTETATLAVERPSKLYFAFTEKKQNNLIVSDGKSGIVRTNGKTEAVPGGSSALGMLTQQIWNLGSGQVRALLGGVTSTKYVTQQLIGDVLVLDVIDVVGPKGTARLYIDGDSAIERLRVTVKGKTTDITYKNLHIDEPIPAARFVVPAL